MALTYTPQPGLLTTQNPTSIHNIFFYALYYDKQAETKPPTLYLLTLQFFIFGITTTTMQSLKILHHFLVHTTVSLNRWKCYSWFQKGIDWDAFKASSSSLLKVRSKLMNVWWSKVVSDNMLRQIKEHETRKEPQDKPQSFCSWKAVTPDFWAVELVSGKHCIRTDDLQFTLYISKDN